MTPVLLATPFAAVLLGGCYATGAGYTSAGPVVVGDADDYVYYPGYEVYYGARHHRYVYRDGDRWVTRSAPPRHTRDLSRAPSVPMRFHDAPEHHHAEIVRQYPRTWHPADGGHRDRDGDRDRH